MKQRELLNTEKLVCVCVCVFLKLLYVTLCELEVRFENKKVLVLL
jgi:hypothetical protein